MEILGGLIVGLVLYFLPTLISISRKKLSTNAIFAVNAFGGLFCLVGWFVALVWSLKVDRVDQVNVKFSLKHYILPLIVIGILFLGLVFGQIGTTVNNQENNNSINVIDNSIKNTIAPVSPASIKKTNLYAEDGRVIKDVPINEIKTYGAGWITEEQKKAKEIKEKLEAQIKIAEQKRIQSLREIIIIKYVKTEEPDFCGGVDLSIIWQNTSKKIVKYISFYAKAYNAVDDEVFSQYDFYKKDFAGQSTGPFNPGKTYGEGYTWKAWYNNTIVRAVLTKIEIQYMDNSSEYLDVNDIKLIKN